MPPNQRQACDACRRRKIRCDGVQPCSACRHTHLHCTFLARPQAKGRQGRSANVISELRASQINNIRGTIAHISEDANMTVRPFIGSRTPGLLSSDTIKACSDFFFSDFTSTLPILDRHMLDFGGSIMETSNEIYYLILSFSAFIILQTGAVHQSATASEGFPLSADVGYGQLLISEAMEARRSANPQLRPSMQAVVTAFLLYGSYRTLSDQSKAWFFLREATTLYTTGMLEENTDSDINKSLAANQLFWVLLITERAYAIRKHRPLTLFISPSSPDLSKLGDEKLASGFLPLVNLFRRFDEKFFALWNETSTECSVDWILELEDHLRNAVPFSPDIPDIQMADLLVTQHWLRMIVWQLSNTLGFLSTASKHESLTFRYPVQVARDLTLSTWKLPEQSLEIHGVGLIEKLFDVAYTLIDVIAYTPAPEAASTGSAVELDPEHYLSYLFHLIHKLRGGDDRFLPMLLRKLEETLPSMTNPLARPLKTPALLDESASIFEYFNYDEV